MKLIINNVSTYYYEKKTKKNVIALDHVSFDVDNGDFIVILGPSGCGKTTLLKCIAGLQPYAGDIKLNNVDIDKIRIQDRNIAYIAQKDDLYPKMTIFDNIAFPLKLINAPYEEINNRVEEVAKKLDIEFLLSRKPKQLSNGQRKKVSLAKAMVRHADLYLFDEPFSALDIASKQELRILLKKLNENLDATFIFVTHDNKEAFALANKLIVMSNSKIEQIASPKEIFNNPINDYVKNFVIIEDEYKSVIGER